MIFLKKFEFAGFKSFGEPVSVELSHPVTGIVGANGTGKSNVLEALKWALGEQSMKSLRGSNRAELVFSGTRYAKKATEARVDLYFNNINGILKTDTSEVKVSRVLNLKNNTNKHYVNDQEVSLKDIKNMFLDTGLSKGSLGIIHQNSVSWFAEAKPLERRAIFEEASGIGLYTNKKNESLNLLTSAQENLNHWNAIITTNKKEIDDLQKQADTLKDYLKVKNELKNLELTLGVRNYLHWSKELENQENILKQKEEEIKENSPELEKIKAIYNKTNDEINALSETLRELKASFELQKNEVEEIKSKRNDLKQSLESIASNSGKREERVKAYQSLIDNEKKEYKNYSQIKDEYTRDLENLNQKLSQKYEEKKSLINERAFASDKYTKSAKDLNKLETIKENSINDKDGAKEILKNKDFIFGIYGLVSDYIKTKPEYELAIVNALARSIYNVIVKNNQSASAAIEFLKKNKAGFATFLPIEDISPKTINEVYLQAINGLEGYIGVASDLVNVDKEFEKVAKNLLGNILVADSLQNAYVISTYSKKHYKVVTLSGEIVNAGGAVFGGEEKREKISLLNLDEKIKQAEQEHETASKNYEEARKKIDFLELDIVEIQKNITNKQYLLSEQTKKVDGSFINIKKWTDSLNAINITIDLTPDNINDQILELEKKENKKLLSFQKLELEIKEKQEMYNSKVLSLSNQTTLKNKEEEKNFLLINEKSRILSNIDRLNISLDQTKGLFINTYELTVENAVNEYKDKEIDFVEKEAYERIRELQAILKTFKNINNDAIDSLELKKQEYETSFAEYTKQKNAVESILESINDLDKKAKKEFMRVIKEVNEKMPEILESLFGGGSCVVSLEDPDNILQSGVEITFNPPGKQNVRMGALSGGEKTMVALVVLFTLLKIVKFPFVVFDEVESALDAVNVERYAQMIAKFSLETQFLVITHRQGTMKNCGLLLGTTMQNNGITKFFKTDLNSVSFDYSKGDN